MSIIMSKKMELAEFIVKEIQEEFSQVHLTGRLAESIKISTFNNKVSIEIAPEFYDIAYAIKTGVIRPSKKTGSYAELVNQTGGLSGTHKSYIETCINKGISKWMNYNLMKAKVR